MIIGMLSESEFENRLKKVQINNRQKEMKKILREEKQKMKHKMKLPSTSKLVLLVVFLMCIEILFFCEFAMIVLGDAEAMYALIGIPAALVPVCLGYFSKSKHENTNGGIIYETAMEKLRQNKPDDNEEAVG